MAKPQTKTEYLVVTLPWIIIIIGVIGNAFCAAVVLRKKFRNKNIGIYLLALAILDTIFLLSNTLFHWGIEILFEKRIQAISDVGCSFVKFFIVASRAMSAWILVVLTVERMLALAIPHLSMSINTKKRAIITTLVVVVVQGIIYCYSFKASTVRDEWNQCWWSAEVVKEGHHLIINIVDFLNYALIPSVVMATSNSVLIYLLKHSQELRSSQSGSSSQGGIDTRSITIIVVTTSIAFIILTMPMTIFQILFVAGVKTGPDYVYPILYSLDLLNHAINFLLYCVSGANFRNEVKEMFTACCKRSNDGTGSTDLKSSTQLGSVTANGSDSESSEPSSPKHVYTNPAQDVEVHDWQHPGTNI